VVGAIVGVFFALAESSQAGAPRKALKIYFVDVEGGQSTLIVTPEGQSLLIDTGWPGNAGRDADRIVAAAKKAGLSKIDFVLLTHYHVDHAGGVPQLWAKIPVGAFIDHGVNREPGDRVSPRSHSRRDLEGCWRMPGNTGSNPPGTKVGYCGGTGSCSTSLNRFLSVSA
jgi:glyoxylase-like metal-dependent hydrolase (beta-lactamase superfamily II)